MYNLENVFGICIHFIYGNVKSWAGFSIAPMELTGATIHFQGLTTLATFYRRYRDSALDKPKIIKEI